VAAGSQACEHWDRGFESHSRRGYLSALFLFMLSCVGSSLATGLIPVQGVLPTVCKIHNSRLILIENEPEGLTGKVEEDFKESRVNVR
jgi:hypothetical protein